MRKIKFPTWSVPIALFATVLLSFGLLIPWLGFYWDDWPSVWFLHFLGPAGFLEVFESDRPLLGNLFLITTSILGESIVGWQLFGLITRWSSSLALWLTIREIWPKRPQFAAWIALLFAVYPGFSQQFISLTYSHVFLILTIFIISYWTMVLAIKKERWFWPLYILSLLCSAYSMFSVEYFFGLELIRPLILWLVLSEQFQEKKKRLQKTLLLWIPYLVLMTLFLVWRIVLTETPRGDVQLFDNLQKNPAAEIFSLLKTILSDIIEGGLIAWLQTFNFLNLRNFGLTATVLFVLVVLVVGALFIFYLLRYRTTLVETDPGTSGSNIEEVIPWKSGGIIIAVGLFSLFIAGWPFWSTELPIGLDFPWDRFTLPMMLGSALFILGILILLTRNNIQRAILVGILIGLAVGLNFQNANNFRREWHSQKTMFWQMSWRAPGIEPNTLLLSSELPFVHFSDNSLTAPLNWIYSPDRLTEQMPYMLYQIESRIGEGLPDLTPGLTIEQDYRAAFFNGSTDQSLVFYYQPPGCLQVLDPEIHSKIPQKPKYMSDAIKLSDVSLIKNDIDAPAIPPSRILGQEPEKDWCYYFEKSDLARQNEDWESIVVLGKQAFGLEQQLYPVNAPEFIPYIEGYARTGEWTTAASLTKDAFEVNDRMDRILCETWLRLEYSTPSNSERDATIMDVRKQLQCE